MAITFHLRRMRTYEPRPAAWVRFATVTGLLLGTTAGCGPVEPSPDPAPPVFQAPTAWVDDAGAAVTPDAPGDSAVAAQSPEVMDASPGADAAPAGDAAAAAVQSLIENPLASPPVSLAMVGIFPTLTDLGQLHPRAFAFEPRHVLWSNGLDKLRQVVLPSGARIDTSNREYWDFPVGTLFFKTFSFKDPAMGGRDRPVETRIIRRLADTGARADQWEFLVYEWAEDGLSASLRDIRLAGPRVVSVDGQTITHQIPSRTECRQCHLANVTPIIGFDELRLNHTLPDQTESQLEQVIARQWLSTPPPLPFEEVSGGRNPLETEILGYMHGNCGHCHNGAESAENITRVFSLRYRDFVANTIGRMTEGRTRTGIRIVPGMPDASILFLAFQRDTNDPELNRMPLIGVQVPDAAVVANLRDWILALPSIGP
jgi:hypothetical protein